MIKNKDKENIKEILASGAKGEFWGIIVDALDETIEHLLSELNGDAITTLPPEQYKLENELLKTKIAYLKKLKNFPQTLGEWATTPDQKTPNFDPYSIPEDFIRKSPPAP